MHLHECYLSSSCTNMEVDTDAFDISVGFNEFEAEFAVSTKDEEGKKLEQEMEIDGAEEITAKNPIESNTSLAKVTPDNGPRQDCPDQERFKSNRRSKSSRRNGDCSEAKSDFKRKGNNNNNNKQNSRLFKILDASPDLDPKILGREIAYRLGETKVGLTINVVKVLGFGKAMEILEETKKIEKRGGIPTADKKRRRTPGGVYIFCLKEMGFATKEQVAEIFKDEKIKLKEIIKRKRKEKNAKQREELSKLKELKERVLKHLDSMNENKTDNDDDAEEIECGEICENTENGDDTNKIDETENT